MIYRQPNLIFLIFPSFHCYLDTRFAPFISVATEETIRGDEEVVSGWVAEGAQEWSGEFMRALNGASILGKLTLILKPGPASRPELHRKLKEEGEGDSKVMNWFLVVKLRFQRLVYLFVELSYPLEVILL